MPLTALSFEDVRRAAERIRPHVHRTPVLRCATLDAMAGAELFFKCENFQRVGAFKIRGATNAVLLLTEAEAGGGVATHSSGNHGAAVALAARSRELPAYVVMPESAPAVKRDAVAGYGAEIVLCPPTQEGREAALAEVVERTGAHFIPPYDDERVIAGQGTAALELLEEVADLDAVVVPVGGGGLSSGTALAAAGLAPGCRVVGVEPERADDARRSLASGRIVPSGYPETVADGLRSSLGEKTFALLMSHGVAIATASEEAILEAMQLVWTRMKIVIEPSAAVPLAAILSGRYEAKGRRVGVILTGGNVSLDRTFLGTNRVFTSGRTD